jgi:hypothetical protein
MGIVSDERPQRRVRNAVSLVQRNALLFLQQNSIAAAANKLKNTARDEIKSYTLPDEDKEELNPNNVRIDENGHRYYDFEEPVTIEGKTYTGLRNQRTVSSFVDMDKVREFFDGTWQGDPDATLSEAEQARRADLKLRVYKPVTTWEYDFEELYRLNQQGLLTDAEIDMLTSTSVTWALNAVKA